MPTIKSLDEIIPFFQLPDGKWKVLDEKEPIFDEKEFIIENEKTKQKYLLTEDYISGDEDFYRKEGYKIKKSIERKPELIEDFEKHFPNVKYRFEYYRIFELES